MIWLYLSNMSIGLGSPFQDKTNFYFLILLHFENRITILTMIIT